MLSKYLINSCPNTILGIVFAGAATLPMLAPAIAQTPPGLTVTNVTSTSSTSVGYPVTYTITVTNAPGASIASNVKIIDLLPLGFTYDSKIGDPVLTGGATFSTLFANPISGDAQPTWNSFTIPPTGKVTLTFVANTNPGLVAGKYDNSIGITYKNSDGLDLIASYDGNSSAAEDVLLTQPTVIPTTGSPPPPPISNAQVCGKPGNDGVGIISGIVNTYFAPTATTAMAGTNSIALGESVGGGNKIDIGDLVLIIQMQDASINSSDSNLYGSGNSSYMGSGQTNMGATGLYEYAIATSNVLPTGGILTIKGVGSGNGLVNSYTNTAMTGTSGQKRFQIVRVPQYASVTLTNTLTALKWNGSVGGVIALDIVGQLNFNGRTIDTIDSGFRAGYSKVHESLASTAAYVASSGSYIGSGKGEGTAGTPRLVWNGSTTVDNGTDGYPSGDTGRGAPANAGGGGNLHNAGGGGGGNGGIGGQGGLPWEGYNGAIDAGGRPGFQSSLYTPAPWRLIMGGGGGGGDANNVLDGVRGGIGGGIAILRAGLIVGSGTILSNGSEGDRGSYSGAPDGAGGGGAGGTVLIQSRTSSPTANINVQANGGRGGNTANDYPPAGATQHGPGGGGGGGVVLFNLPGGIINATTNGGASGISGDGTGTPHGATNGQIGQTGTFGNNDPFGGVNGGGCLPSLKVTKVTSTPKVNRNGLAKYKITVTNTALIGSAVAVNIEDPLPLGFTYSSTDSIVFTGNATQPIVTNPTTSAIKPIWGQFTIPPAGKVEINFQTKVNQNVTSGTYQNQADAVYLDPARIEPTGLLTNTYDPSTSIDEDVTVNGNAQVLMVKRITAINDLATNPNDSTKKLDKFIHNTSTAIGVPINDQNCYWPTATADATNPSLCNNTYTIGEVTAGSIKPGDTIEYTVYFVNSGGADAKNVKICDILRPNQTYVSNSLKLKLGEDNILDLTDANDPSQDRGQFVPANDPDLSKTSNCNLSGTNNNGVVALDLTGTTGSPTLNLMPSSTSAGQPPLSYGFFRFKTKVNP